MRIMEIKEEISLSLPLERHPALKETEEYRKTYLSALRHFVNAFHPGDPVTEALIRRYERTFLPSQTFISDVSTLETEDVTALIRKISRIDCFRLRLSSHRYLFFTDCLFLCAGTCADVAESLLPKLLAYFPPKYHKKLNAVFEAIYRDAPLKKRWEPAKTMTEPFRENVCFLSYPVKTVLITATMSAGKSTFINAVTGKPLARTSQAACTGNLHTFLNKPIEDGFITVSDETGVYLETNSERAFQAEAQGKCCVASYFRTFADSPRRLRIIDTPGVNSAIHESHGQITIEALRNLSYDQLIYLFRADGLGRDEDLSYLKRVAEIAQKEKTVFVLNKLDLFKMSEDSIQESLDGVREDLRKLGYEQPVLCPFSAYFAYLIKRKLLGEALDEDEEDDFQRYARKFRKPDFDLSRYYQTAFSGEADELLELSVKCGLYSLEGLLFDA